MPTSLPGGFLAGCICEQRLSKVQAEDRTGQASKLIWAFLTRTLWFLLPLQAVLPAELGLCCTQGPVSFSSLTALAICPAPSKMFSAAASQMGSTWSPALCSAWNSQAGWPGLRGWYWSSFGKPKALDLFAMEVTAEIMPYSGTELQALCFMLQRTNPASKCNECLNVLFWAEAWVSVLFLALPLIKSSMRRGAQRELEHNNHFY